MIKTFRCEETEKLHQGHSSKRFKAFEKVARRKLKMLDAATQSRDLKSPGNQFEALKDDRLGQHSIRINEQWRICFEWKDGDAYGVEIVDFH